MPLYFKFVNIATGSPNKRTLARNDRVVIYASEAQIDFVEGLLSSVVKESPEAFTGRQVAGFGEVLAGGITRADDVTKAQNEKFKGHTEGTSFNDLRNQLIYEVTMNVTKDLVVFPEYASTKVGGQTIRQKFTDELSKSISKRVVGTVVAEDDPLLLKVLACGLSTEQLRESGQFGESAIRSIQDALARTARDVLPYIQPGSLLRGYRHHIELLAPRYGIDPGNLAKNVPIAN